MKYARLLQSLIMVGASGLALTACTDGAPGSMSGGGAGVTNHRGIDTHVKRWSLLGEQWWGLDGDDDGFGEHAGSSGGFLRLRYAVGDHAYAGIRYDAGAAPTAVRDVVIYAAAQVAKHARLLLENKRVQNGASTLEGALTVGFPWPAKE